MNWRVQATPKSAEESLTLPQLFLLSGDHGITHSHLHPNLATFQKSMMQKKCQIDTGTLDLGVRILVSIDVYF